MKNGKIGFAVIGFGVIGPHHAKGIELAPDAELVAVCDIDPKCEEKLRSEGYDVPFYTSYEEMIESEKDIDVVNICTYSGIHYESAVYAADHGLHVVSEKPLDVTLEHMDQMIKAAERNNVRLGCIFQRRTLQASKLVKKALEDGLLGKLVAGDCYQKYYRSPAYYKTAGWRGTWELDGGGALMNQAVHGIDLLLWLMGEAESLFSYSDTLVREIEVEDTSMSVIRFRNGAIGTIVGTTSVVPGQSCRTEIHGELGSIILNEGELTCHVAKLVDGVHKPEEVDLEELYGCKSAEKEDTQEKHSTASDNTALSSEGHAGQIQDMARAILDNREPMVTGRDARKSVELILAIYESSKKHQEVKLPLA